LSLKPYALTIHPPESECKNREYKFNQQNKVDKNITLYKILRIFSALPPSYQLLNLPIKFPGMLNDNIVSAVCKVRAPPPHLLRDCKDNISALLQAIN
jgi:hypothetical protein